jgi:hypothetical protein
MLAQKLAKAYQDNYVQYEGLFIRFDEDFSIDL